MIWSVLSLISYIVTWICVLCIVYLAIDIYKSWLFTYTTVSYDTRIAIVKPSGKIMFRISYGVFLEGKWIAVEKHVGYFKARSCYWSLLGYKKRMFLE